MRGIDTGDESSGPVSGERARLWEYIAVAFDGGGIVVIIGGGVVVYIVVG